jgi:2-C-methyl-D-erythritol 4-phosphate cytidylyltransferase / 2-C-methyl-D-erythritol 2,4-cyclodiphosphate synthase
MGGPDSADAIIVAAGASTRMGGVDKLMAPINGRPLLAWTLAALAESPVISRIVLVVAGDRFGAVEDAPWLPAKLTAIVLGGERRQESVAAGIEALRGRTRGHKADDRVHRVVLVHDGARPMASEALIASVAEAAQTHGAAIPVIAVHETIKRLDRDVVVGTVDRSSLATAQTPQGIRISLLLDAYARFPPNGPETWTDEAALLEACEIPVHVVPGDPANVKVTTPADLNRVADLLGDVAVRGTGNRRTGIGQDTHPFGPMFPLRLGGIEIDGAPALHGHSDGDVALHALADALLGAAGSGDLGRLFPAGPSTPRGADSRELLAAVVARLAGDGWRPTGTDLTIVAARPRLGPHLDAMREAIAATLGLPPEAVNVKASTGNFDGAEGAGRAISALTVATIERRP